MSEQNLKALLSKGYFPKELPLVFTTDGFGANIVEVLKDWEAGAVFSVKNAGKVPGTNLRKNKSYTYGLDTAEIEVISKPKRGYERRNIHITHPVPQALLCRELVYNWRTIGKWLARGRYSLDKIELSHVHDRAIKDINFKRYRAKKSYIEAMSNYVVKTDITRFYPTIYTHSISWAAHGRERVKSNLRLFQGNLADRIDLLVRSCNRNQTIGIPVGPETSRIIAEIISSRVDSEFHGLSNEINSNQIDRLQDDWHVGVDTFEAAESVIASISACYKEFGLEINGHKTSISRLIANSGSDWASELEEFISHRSSVLHGNRLRGLLTFALRLQSVHPNEPVIPYVLAILESLRIDGEDVEFIETFLLKAAVLSPIAMDRICRIVLNIQHDTGGVSRDRLKKRFTKLAEDASINGKLFELIWLSYTLRGLRISLDSQIISGAAEVLQSSAVGLILLDMDSKGLFGRKLPKDKWSSKITPDSVLTDWVWLLGYEGIRHGWLADRNGVMSQPFFAAMVSRKIIFYDSTRNVLRSRKIVSSRFIARKLEAKEVTRMLQELRHKRFFGY